eukprot:TRINITY_DN7376_c0_g1_i1.p1 TRINITY_DN7376_c0_g1~~TRINITY_DN7376_c0_g1_i1.p1  ORF type:complete len:465 (+),score=89.86 TRINITY_DN7376_c0_g1_i1:1037-2431(+)
MIDILLTVQLAVLCCCAYNVGRLFVHILKVPAITGYILTGIICGPHNMALIGSDPERLGDLKRIEQGCLSIIGLAAGCELIMKELKSQGKAITFTVLSILPCVAGVLGVVTTNLVPTTEIFQKFSANEVKAICLMMSTILLARSPASAIAVVKESNAEGAFTKLCVCASIVLDTCVVSLFAININFAKLIVDGVQMTPSVMMQPFVKLALSAMVGYVLYHFLTVVIMKPAKIPPLQKFLLRAVGTYVSGAFVFLASDTLRGMDSYGRIDPLLCCVACGAFFSNASPPKEEFVALVDETLPWTNIPFFTLVGCSLSFKGLGGVLPLVFTLFAGRLVALLVGAWAGAHLAGLPSDYHHFRWMGFVTQAGVAIGLCKQISLEFPYWGKAVHAVCVSCILVNLLLGPVCFKWILQRVGEVTETDVINFVAGPGLPQWPAGTPKHLPSSRTTGSPKHMQTEINVMEMQE